MPAFSPRVTPTVLQTVQKWASMLSPEQRAIALDLADRMRKQGGFDTSMIPDFQKVGQRSMTMEFLLRVWQWSPEKLGELVQDTISMLELAREET